MVCYLDRIRAESERLFAVSAHGRVAERRMAEKEWADRLTPLEERLRKLISEIPPEIMAGGLSLDSLRRLLAGKWRGNCHPGELGAALRKLRFVRRRDWSDVEGGFRAKWYREP